MSENRKRSVGKRCVAYGCSTKYGDGFALHLFPTNADLCKMWTNFVQKKRDKWDGPTTYSALCEKHFEDGSYPMKYAILRSMGQTPPKKKVLNADAIPTIQTAFSCLYCRLLLGVLHYNENGGRDPAVTKDGNTCYNIVYPKHKKGEYTVREVKMEPTFDYVQELLQITVNKATNTRMTKTQDVLMDAPPALCSTFERPSKLEAVSSVQSRFA
ncbi:uncharacterized protein LOC132550582 [Ylistrum balloti]|uniref:uncharacterized protein LOC132550582 n=1 Tax=Ylistrum balloti TaxID=509963 RepID=UPI0029058D90|nr:uncharacterized protein LOC132550582 [Ylistrum balloti]